MSESDFNRTIQWYDENAETYSCAISEVSPTAPVEWFLTFLPAKAEVLEVGCAGGRESALFLERGIAVTGVDISTGLLELARQQNPEVHYINADFRHLPLSDASFDGVWSHASLVHLEAESDVAQALAEFYRVLRPSGHLYVYVKEQLGERATEVVTDSLTDHARFFRFYSEADLRQWLTQAGFCILALRRQEDGHGRTDVRWIELVAEKQ